MQNLLNIEPGLIIWTFLTFGLLLWILKRFAWKPLISALEKREERIHSDLQRSEHAREESEKLLAEHKKMMLTAEIEARRIVEDARKTAEKVKTDILTQANDQAAQIAVQARAEIQREKDSALAQLRSEIADLAIGAATRILKESIDEQRGKRIVDTFIAEFPKN